MAETPNRIEVCPVKPSDFDVLQTIRCTAEGSIEGDIGTEEFARESV
jgi:hypothetical protein